MPTIVQTFQGRVTALWGTASMRGADGKMHVLKLGDLVHRGDVILTSQDGIVKLTPDDAETSAFAATRIGEALAPATEIDRVIGGLNDANSLDAPAAGLAGDGAAGELAPGLRVGRISEATSLLGALPSGSLSFDVREISAVAPELLNAAPGLLGAGSSTINATEEGPAVGLGLPAPTGTTTAAIITVTQVPVIGQLLKADGTPVATGSVLTPADLVGLKYVHPPTTTAPQRSVNSPTP